jgi:hypothetical protein
MTEVADEVADGAGTTMASRHQGEVVQACQPTGNLVPDAHLAALAREHGLTVISTDTDFAKFADVAWINPCRGRA